MFTLKRRDKRTGLEKEIDRIQGILSKMKPDDPNYPKIIESLERMYKAKSYEKPRSITPDTKAIVIGSLVGTLLIIFDEQLGRVITSKAFGLILKGRV